MRTIKQHSSSQKFKGMFPKCAGLMLAVFLSPGTSMAASIDPHKFHQALYELHQKMIKDKQVRLVETEGQYNGSAAGSYRYRDTHYYDATNGRLLSHIKRDTDNPEAIHIVEVNIYDNNGNILRDFGSISLPAAPALAVRTFINFHQYNKGLHSFRQFGADGEVTYESCKGLLGNQVVNISLDDIDIKPVATTTAEYKACFEGIESAWSTYAIPH